MLLRFGLLFEEELRQAREPAQRADVGDCVGAEAEALQARVVFTSDLGSLGGKLDVFAVDAAGMREPHLVFAHADGVHRVIASSDGEWLVMQTDDESADLLAVRRGEDEAIPLLNTDYDEQSPALSPDGEWSAYSSDESGVPQVSVRPFPNVDDARYPVSLGGGGVRCGRRRGANSTT